MTTSFALPKQLLSDLKNHAHNEQRSVSFIIRSMIEQALKENRK